MTHSRVTLTCISIAAGLTRSQWSYRPGDPAPDDDSATLVRIRCLDTKEESCVFDCYRSVSSAPYR